LIHGTPERRRRYLDFILVQTIPGYAKTLSQYRRVLGQRNRVLSDWHGATSELFAWNVRLAELATDIHNARHQLIDHINELVGECYQRIAGSTEPIHLTYLGSTGGDMATEFLQLLEDNLSRDTAAGFTTIGPHRDDFAISFKGSAITAVASRGEMRTVVLALKMAELAYIERQTETRPMLLLDDVFSELDDSRRRFLLDTLGGYQSVITTTNADVSEELSAKHTTILTQELQRAQAAS
jgi:DNA replication and repair protein RecF